MKLKLKHLALTFMVLVASATACNKAGTALLPNLADFSITAATMFVKGVASIITVHSSTLGNGVFTINFNLSGANIVNQNTATLTMNGGTGTFSTPVLAKSGATALMINSVANLNGSTPLTTNNTFNFFDSTGIMTASINGVTFSAIDVTASLAGSMLSIHGTKWSPLSVITVTLDHYTHATGSMSSPSLPHGH